ncbi:D-glycero-alpha-D-manno-heptose-1,7-bisphosphate 7-phosphatase [bacterium]
MKNKEDILKSWNIDKSWSLFLDRDGVINKRLIDDYVKTWEEFEFLLGSLKAISILAKIFNRIFIITNQRGIARKLMTENDLAEIHKKMLEIINEHGGRIDSIYYCPHDRDDCSCRKPDVSMAHDAKKDFPDIQFEKSIIIGDSDADIELGKRLDMKKVFIGESQNLNADLTFKSLCDFAILL